MRSYGEYCSISKALDVVRERSTLLIIRGLLVRGGSRSTDIKNGLPGIASTCSRTGSASWSQQA